MYLTVPIHLQDRKFLRFSWEQEVFQFRSLPFGLASAPRTFTKLLRPLLALLRSQGLRMVVFLDDILLMASSEELIGQHLTLLVSWLEELGFIINKDKSVMEPGHQIVSWSDSQLQHNVTLSPSRQDCEGSEVMSPHVGQRSGISPGAVSLNRTALFSNPGSPPSSFTLPSPSETQTPGSHLFGLLGFTGVIELLFSKGFSVLGLPVEGTQWEEPRVPCCNYYYLFRCIQIGLGRLLQHFLSGRALESSRTGPPYQCLRAKGGLSGFEVLGIPSEGLSYPPAAGQHYSDLIHQPQGGYEITYSSGLALEIWTWCLQRGITVHSEQFSGLSDETFHLISTAWRGAQKSRTTQPGPNGVAGVLRGRLIPFYLLERFYFKPTPSNNMGLLLVSL